jgi:hypothetical protein
MLDFLTFAIDSFSLERLVAVDWRMCLPVSTACRINMLLALVLHYEAAIAYYSIVIVQQPAMAHS